MGRSIVKHTLASGEDRYLVWSSIVDAPITFGGTLKQLRDFWRKDYGERGLEDLEVTIALGVQTWPERGMRSVADMAGCNRAGLDETRLSAAQIIDYYFVVVDPKVPLPRGLDWANENVERGDE